MSAEEDGLRFQPFQWSIVPIKRQTFGPNKSLRGAVQERQMVSLSRRLFCWSKRPNSMYGQESVLECGQPGQIEGQKSWLMALLKGMRWRCRLDRKWVLDTNLTMLVAGLIRPQKKVV